MVESQEMESITRTAVVLTKFLDEAKSKGSSHARISNNTDYLINSIRKIALEAELQVNTVADAFNGKRSARIPTIALILKAMNKTMTDFGKAYDKVSDSDIQKFKERSTQKKSSPVVKKKARK